MHQGQVAKGIWLDGHLHAFIVATFIRENPPRQLAPIMRQLGPIGRIEVLVELRQSEIGTLPIGYIEDK